MRAEGGPRGQCLSPGPRWQTGQAAIYGLFVILGAVVALFFLFNTGQLSAEKTKLVNTGDAVAYSAGVMNARTGTSNNARFSVNPAAQR